MNVKKCEKMSGDVQSEYLQLCPTEVLIHIFTFLKAKQLMKCRQICWRWRRIIESLNKNELLWRKHCQSDFPEIFKSAYNKCKTELSWYNMYRSLSLWTCIHQADVSLEEFTPASRDKILDFKVLRQGTLGVHTQRGIVYYNLTTLERSDRATIQGEYLRYAENDDHLVVLATNLELFIERKTVRSPRHQLRESFSSVKNFILNDDHCYFTTIDNYIHICQLGYEQFQSSRVATIADEITSLGYKNGHLNVMSSQRDIFQLVGRQLVFQCTLDNTWNVFQVLREYNLLESFHWRLCFPWMWTLDHSVPQNTIRSIIIAKVYGEFVLVGMAFGVFSIYYAHSEGIELFNTQPVKQFHFMGRHDLLSPSLCHIVQIDVIEGEGSHTVLVGMTNKIAVLEFNHTLEKSTTHSVFTYEDLQNLKRVKMIDR